MVRMWWAMAPGPYLMSGSDDPPPPVDFSVLGLLGLIRGLIGPRAACRASQSQPHGGQNGESGDKRTPGMLTGGDAVAHG